VRGVLPSSVSGMDRSGDPAFMRVGIHVGSAEDGEMAVRLVSVLRELAARSLDLLRVGIVAAPILHQSIYLHEVSFCLWFFRVLVIYALLGTVTILFIPEQVYKGVGLNIFQDIFERFTSDAKAWAQESGTVADTNLVLARVGLGDLEDINARLRWQGTEDYVCLDRQGWAVPGPEDMAITVLLQKVQVTGEKEADDKLPDTYVLCINDESSRFHQMWLSFRAINQLRFGGWLGAFNNMYKACPYKVIQDTSCPTGSCKLMCSWPCILSATQNTCNGFYVAKQLYGKKTFIGHAPDNDAALLEMVTA